MALLPPRRRKAKHSNLLLLLVLVVMFLKKLSVFEENKDAMRELGVSPDECVAFEDSLSGIKSAQAAGMLVIAVKNLANAALPVSPDEEPDQKTGIEPLMDRIIDFDALDRRFMF